MSAYLVATVSDETLGKRIASHRDFQPRIISADQQGLALGSMCIRGDLIVQAEVDADAQKRIRTASAGVQEKLGLGMLIATQC